MTALLALGRDDLRAVDDDVREVALGTLVKHPEDVALVRDSEIAVAE